TDTNPEPPISREAEQQRLNFSLDNALTLFLDPVPIIPSGHMVPSPLPDHQAESPSPEPRWLESAPNSAAGLNRDRGGEEERRRAPPVLYKRLAGKKSIRENRSEEESRGRHEVSEDQAFFGAAMGLAPGLTILIILPAFLHTSGLYIASSVDSLQHVLGEYGLVRPVSVDADGRFLSHAVSAGRPGAGAGQPHRRWRREAGENRGGGGGGEGDEEREEIQLYYNVTVFGREFHLRLRHNARLVAPGAKMEWHDDNDSNGTATRSEPLQGDCFYVGDVTDTPGATVAISNCDGLTTERERGRGEEEEKEEGKGEREEGGRNRARKRSV
ncbi:unnamed protein product, partial [Coregonus sp. 'balchen']